MQSIKPIGSGNRKMKIQRLLAFLIDHVIFSFVGCIIFFFINFDSFIYQTEENFNEPFETIYPFLTVYMLIIYNKDFFQGRSIGKRVIGITVRDLPNSNITPGKLRLFLRNIFLIIWPVEIIMLLVTGRRIGDFLIKTQVIRMNSESKLEEGINIT